MLVPTRLGRLELTRTQPRKTLVSHIAGFRKSELLTLEWKNVHEDHLHLPMTKNGRSFDLPILQFHHEILAPLRGLSRQWVFPSPKSPSGHLSAPQRMRRRPVICRRRKE